MHPLSFTTCLRLGLTNHCLSSFQLCQHCQASEKHLKRRFVVFSRVMTSCIGRHTKLGTLGHKRCYSSHSVPMTYSTIATLRLCTQHFALNHVTTKGRSKCRKSGHTAESKHHNTEISSRVDSSHSNTFGATTLFTMSQSTLLEPPIGSTPSRMR